MNRKQYILALALLLIAGLCGGVVSGRLLAGAPAEARQEVRASKTYGGQKWEYCALTKAAYVGSNRNGRYWVSYFSDKGAQVVEYEETALERNGPAKAIAKLADEGWEMVGEGPLDIRQGELRALYFKRPKL
jgi:hypothetical protein